MLPILKRPLRALGLVSPPSIPKAAGYQATQSALTELQVTRKTTPLRQTSLENHFLDNREGANAERPV